MWTSFYTPLYINPVAHVTTIAVTHKNLIVFLIVLYVKLKIIHLTIIVYWCHIYMEPQRAVNCCCQYHYLLTLCCTLSVIADIYHSLEAVEVIYNQDCYVCTDNIIIHLTRTDCISYILLDMIKHYVVELLIELSN